MVYIVAVVCIFIGALFNTWLLRKMIGPSRTELLDQWIDEAVKGPGRSR